MKNATDKGKRIIQICLWIVITYLIVKSINTYILRIESIYGVPVEQFAILSYAISYILFLLIYVVGTYLFGKTIGYQVLYVRFFHLKFRMQTGKLKIRKVKVNQIACQCNMAPPGNDPLNYPFVLYTMGGIFSNILFSLILLVISNLIVDNLVSFFFKIVSIYILIRSLFDAIPKKRNGIGNAGLFTYQMLKGKDVRQAFWINRNWIRFDYRGINLGDAPSEWFELPSDADYSSYDHFYLGYLRFFYLHYKKQYDEAKNLINFMIDHAPNAPEQMKKELLCELLFYEIIGLCNADDAIRIYTPDLQQYINENLHEVSKIRIKYAFEKLIMKNETEASRLLIEFEKLANDYEYPAELSYNRELLRLIDEKAALTDHII